MSRVVNVKIFKFKDRVVEDNYNIFKMEDGFNYLVYNAFKFEEDLNIERDERAKINSTDNFVNKGKTYLYKDGVIIIFQDSYIIPKVSVFTNIDEIKEDEINFIKSKIKE